MSVTFSLNTENAHKDTSSGSPGVSLFNVDVTDSGKSMPSSFPSTAASAPMLIVNTANANDSATYAPAHPASHESASLVGSARAGRSGTPTSTRSARKPAVLSLSVQSLDIDDADLVPPQAAPAASVGVPTTAATPSTPPSRDKADVSVFSPIPADPAAAVGYTTPTADTATSAGVSSTGPPRGKTITTAHATASGTSVPMLQLPIKACKDEVTPVKTLYSRLFREAQLREQRQAQAQRKQRAAQKAEEKEACTFHPQGAEAFGKTHNTAAESDSVSGNRLPTRASAHPMPSNDSHYRTTKSQEAKHADVVEKPRGRSRSRSTQNEGDAETAACERLYRNAEQNERRELRLRQLREAQEEEFHNICTFQPCVSPPSARRHRSVSAGHPSQKGASESRLSADEDLEDSKDAANATSVSRSGTSPRRLSRSWEHFLADQAEHQALQERRLDELKKRAAEEDHAKLFTGVPRSKASLHLRTYLEKKKGYKGPIEGWTERFDHYMKVKQEAEAQSPYKAATTHACGSVSPSRKAAADGSESANGASARSPSVFHRLYHDSDEREAMRELIRLMREQHEQAELYKPNAHPATTGDGDATTSPRKDNGSASRTPRSGASRRSPPSAGHVDAARATAAAVALAAAGGEDAAQNGSSPRTSSPPPPPPHKDAPSIFDTLYAETEQLQRRRELRHLQAQNTAEVYPFHPHLSKHSRELAKEAARQKAKGQHTESVRERRAREAAQIAAQEAARRGRVQFRYDTFAQRQTERDRRREDELLHVLLHERHADLEACRFRPAISAVTEAIVEGNKNYTQVIDDPAVAHSLATRRASKSASVSAGRDATTGAPAAAVENASNSSARGGAVPLSTPGGLTRRSQGKPPTTAIEALAAESDDVEEDYGAPAHTHSAASSVSTDKGLRRPSAQKQQGNERSQPPVDSSHHAAVRDSGAIAASTDGGISAERQSDAVDGADTVHIAGAASSEYLRQLESELQDALRDWSQCV